MQFSPQQPLSMPPLLHCMCAADAMAQGDQVGIGGWLSTSDSFLWFACTWNMADVRQTWPFLVKDAQKYIACFEVLAQLALLQCTYARLRHKHQRFCLPSATDNSPSEAGLNKLFSTAEPISHFIKLAAQWAHARGVQLLLTHLPGEKNAWADELSRNKLARFQHRSSERVHVQLLDLAMPATGTRLAPPEASWPPSLAATAACPADYASPAPKQQKKKLLSACLPPAPTLAYSLYASFQTCPGQLLSYSQRLSVCCTASAAAHTF